MIFLTLGQVALGLSISVGYGGNYGNVQQSFINDHILVTNNSITLTDFTYNNLLGSAGLTTINDFNYYQEEDFLLTFHCNYYENSKLKYSFDIDSLHMVFYTSNNTKYLSIESIVDNDTMLDGVNFITNYSFMLGLSALSYDAYSISNTQMIANTQYDTILFNRSYNYTNTTFLKFNSISLISIAEDVARDIGEAYYGSNDFNSGYKVGKDEGLKEGYLQGLEAGETEAFQAGKDEGYAEGVADAMASGHITEIFSNIVQVGILPINVFLAMLNFEVFGINIGSFASGLLTIAIVIIVVRIVTGASASGGGKNGD